MINLLELTLIIVVLKNVSYVIHNIQIINITY